MTWLTRKLATNGRKKQESGADEAIPGVDTAPVWSTDRVETEAEHGARYCRCGPCAQSGYRRAVDVKGRDGEEGAAQQTAAGYQSNERVKNRSTASVSPLSVRTDQRRVN